MDTETLIKKLAATTAPRRVMTGVCDALIERDKLRAENERLRKALGEIAEAADYWRDSQATLSHIQDIVKETLTHENPNR